MNLIFFLLTLTATLTAIPSTANQLYILKTGNLVTSLNKHGRWLEKYLDTEKCIINSPRLLPEKGSHKIIFLTTLMSTYSRKTIGQYRNSVAIAHSVFESTRVPQVWVDELNQYFDLVTVSDPFLVDAYKNSGVLIPILLLPEGSLLEEWLELTPPKKKSGPFVFLASGSFSQLRKNHDILIEAFRAAFGEREDVQLQIQVRGHKAQVLIDRAEAIVKKYDLNHAKNIKFHFGDLDDKEYKKLFLSCDCLVNIASGEGFSITPREALAVGIPAIVTDNTAQCTICQSGFVRAVPCPLIIDAYYDEFGFTGHQFNPTVEGVTEALLDMYQNYPHYKDLALQAKPWVRQYTTESLLPLWRNLLAPKTVLFGDRTEVTDAYFMTDSPTLYKKMHALAL